MSADKALKLNYYQRLKWNIFVLMLLVICIPLPIVAGTIYHYYQTFVRASVEDNLKGVVAKRREAIEVFLAERVSYLRTLSRLSAFSPEQGQEGLEPVFAMIKPLSPTFVDMGIIDAEGRQVAYVGPYDLQGKNYSDTLWFRQVRRQGVYISDVFLGYRNVPHLAIAVRGPSRDSPWYLRATINTETFKRLMRSSRAGTRRDAYLFKRNRELQLHLGEREPVDPGTIVLPPRDRIQVGTVSTVGGHQLLTAAGWLNRGRWLLLVAEDPDSEFVSLFHARRVGLYLFFTSVLLVAVLAYYTALWIARKVEAADREKDLIQERLAQTSKLISLGKMAAGLAHEINNPLAIISESAGYAMEVMDLAGDKLGQGRRREIRTALEDIVAEAFRGKDITQRLLGFARKVEAKIVEVDINQVAADLLKYYARILAKTGKARLSSRFDPDLPRVRTDPGQVQQVLINLIDNAIHFTSRSGGKISLSTEACPGGVRIRVQDNGPGMPPGVKDKIFDPFFTTKPVGEGTGLGLAICYGIVKKLGGEIYVDSEEGKGATFTIELPLAPPEEVQE